MDRNFGNLLRTLRMRCGLTQRQLADLSTVSVRAIRDLESGRASRPRPDTVRLIADGLGLSGGGRSDFESAARADARPPAALPAPLSVMLGRDTERADLCALLASGTQRLVTLTGLSGVGKTRLATAVAQTLRDVDGLSASWATAVDLADPAAFGAGAGSVLVLDGLDEHAPADRVTALLARRADLRVLCTARTPLAVPGERVFHLAPLAVPPRRTETKPDALSLVPAIRLLLHHVDQIRPGFRLTAGNCVAVAAVVRGLAGVPLLLAAAAAWFLVYEPAELLAYLRADPAGFVTGRVAEWRAAVMHTVAGLDADCRAVLSALAERAVPRPVADLARDTGHRPLDCAAALGRLVLCGLVTVDRTGVAGRFRVLEPVRAVWRDLPIPAVETAAVLPLRLPVPAVRAG
jgi:transcriptional regulator with XRE-family HTH domain